MEKVWECWNEPKHITSWAFASDDWEVPTAENDLRVNGKLKVAMAAKDKSAGFDFAGTYLAVNEHKLIEYVLDDGRHVKINFKKTPGGVEIIESFDPEKENSEDLQRSGWQAILDNFKKYVENTGP